MAVRPLLTTGAALLSAGALVAATPALFVPRDEVAIAAPAAASTPHKLSDAQVQLLAFSLQGALDSFVLGYGGVIDEDYLADGFLGLAYYTVDSFAPNVELQPERPLDNVFFEQGATGVAYDISKTAAQQIDLLDPTGGRLDLETRVDDFFEGGATQLIQHLIDDNLPDDGIGVIAKAFNQAFFEGGVVAVATLAYEIIRSVIVPPEEDPDEDEDAAVTLRTTEEATVEEGPVTSTDTTLKPFTPLKDLASTFKAPKPGNLLSLPAPTTAEVEEPAEPEVKAKPQLNVVKANPLADLTENLPFGKPTGKGGGAFAKGDTNGQKFVKQLKDAFGPKDKPADDGADAGGDDSE